MDNLPPKQKDNLHTHLLDTRYNKDMTKAIGFEAFIPNLALKPFEKLLGEWQTTGSHPYFSGVELHGRASFSWHEGGAFIISNSGI
jgi:hypothetical protein